MGSFDATCVLSDIGIGGGDKIACLLLQESNYGKLNNVWSPVSPLLPGEYYDYGQIELDEDPVAFLRHLKPWIVPLPAGANHCHEQSVDPDHCDWASIQEHDADDRLFLYANERDVPAFKDKPDESNHEYYSLQEIRKALTDAGINPNSPYSEGNCYLHTVGDPGVIIADLGFGVKVDNPIVAKIQEAVRAIGYCAYPIPGEHENDKCPRKEGRDIRLLFLQSPDAQVNFDLKEYKRPNRIHASRAFIRMDVLDALCPINDRMIRRAQVLCDKRKSFMEKYSDKNLNTLGYRFSMEIINSPLDLWFSSEYSSAHYDHITPQILAMPDDSPVDAFIPWVRLSDVICKSRGDLRRGLRPTACLVGSQEANEDWGEQLKYHQKMVKVLRPLVARAKKDYAY